MRRDIDGAVRAVADPRAGAFLRREVRALGADRHLERRRCAAGTWIEEGGGVLTLAAYPRTIAQRRWVGILAGRAGAHVSFECAAELLRLDGVVRGLVVVTVDHPEHPVIEGITFHQLTDVRPHHLTTIDGFPTTTAARTIIDLAAVVSWVRLQRAIEDAIVRRLTTFGELARLLQEVRRRGKPGVRKLVATLDRLAGEPPPASEGERLLHVAARRAGVALSRQHPLPARAHVPGVVDAVVVESKLILEADSRTWHGRLDAMAKDRERDREAARLGWLTLRFVYADLANDVGGCAEDIRAVHLQRRPDRTRGRAVHLPQRPPSSSVG